MLEVATVLRLKDNDRAVVEVKRNTACENCAAKCIIGDSNINVEAEIEGVHGVAPGDRIMVELEFASLIGASVIAYGLPFAGLVAGMSLGYFLMGSVLGMDSDTAGFIFAMAGMALGGLALRLLHKADVFSKKYRIKMARLAE